LSIRERFGPVLTTLLVESQVLQTQNVTTTSVLLASLREARNRTAWLDFDARYRRIIEGFARRLGLDEHDAADVAQQTLVEFARDYQAGRYDRAKGRLSAWIMGIARHRAVDLQRATGRRKQQRGTSALLDVAERELTRIWDTERDQTVFDRALAELRENSRTSPRTMRVFELVAIRGVPAADVAEQCELSVDEVYRVKNRVTKRLREIVARLSCEYEE
jgi:RNA polymerase sigma-70 factor (ECF subfamily)